jgi:hypothetical protein
LCNSNILCLCLGGTQFECQPGHWHPDWGFWLFCSVTPSKCQRSLRPWLFLSKTFSFHRHFPTVGTTYS